MKKHLLVAALLLAAMVVPLAGQGLTLISRGQIDASEPYWGMPSIIPASMLAWTTNGMLYDEWDTVLRSPTELSGYSGYGLYTAYGNYEVQRTSGVGSTVNPFTTTSFTPSNFYLGATFPFLSQRAGLVTGFTGSTSANYTGGLISSGGSNSNTVHNAAGTANQFDWSWTDTYTDWGSSNRLRFGAGADLGNAGVAVLASVNASSRTMGGHYAYTNAASTTNVDGAYTRANNVVASKTINFGGGTDGAPKGWADGGSWEVGILGDVPLFPWMPVRATIYLAGVNGANLATNVVTPGLLPMTTTTTGTNLAGVATTTATAVSTLTQAAGLNSTWAAKEYSAGQAASENSLAYATAFSLTSTNKAIDVANYKDGAFKASVGGQADPTYKLRDGLVLKGRLSANYYMSITSSNTAYLFSEGFTGQTGATSGLMRLTTTHTYAETAPTSVFDGTFALEAGGTANFTAPVAGIEIGVGLFLRPTFQSASTTHTDSVVRESWNLTDPASTIADQTTITTYAAAAALMSNAGAATSQGTKTKTTTVSWAANDTSSTATWNFLIPVTARIGLSKALSLVCAYDITYGVWYMNSTTAKKTTTTAYSVTNVAGTSMISSPTDALVPTVTAASSSSDTGVTALAGRAGFMLRWVPSANMTVDFGGAGLMNALNFDLFGDNTTGTDFNIRNVINTLTLSIGIRV